MVHPADGAHVVSKVEEDGERIIVVAINCQCGQGGSKVDNDSNKLQDVDANQIFIGVVFDECLLFFDVSLVATPNATRREA